MTKTNIGTIDYSTLGIFNKVMENRRIRFDRTTDAERVANRRYNAAEGQCLYGEVMTLDDEVELSLAALECEGYNGLTALQIMSIC